MRSLSFPTATATFAVVATSLLGFAAVPASAQIFTVISNNDEWRESQTVITDGANDVPWGGVAPGSLPAVGTYTIIPTTGAGSVTPLPDASNLFSGSGIHFFRTTFTLPAFTSLTLDLRTYVDNDINIFFNGTELALEGSLDTNNFGGADPLRLRVAANGVVSNGPPNGQPFDEVAPTFANFFAGENEIVLAVRNLNGGDSGGFSFRADFDVVPTVSGVAPEPSALALLAAVALPALCGCVARRRVNLKG